MAKILLCDDDRELTRQTAMYFAAHGHDVTVTDNGKDALARLEVEGPFDVMVLDIRMPGLDGNAVLECVKPNEPPVFVHTGTDSALKDSVGWKVKRVFVKPYEPREMLAAVESLTCKRLPEPPAA